MAKPLKIGVWRLGGPAPGYRWTVGILDMAFDEALKLLTEAEYQHLAMQVKDLAQEVDPTHSETQTVEKVEDYFELKDKGGILRKKNIRVFFGVDKPNQAIIVLGTIKKENNGPTPTGVKVRMRRRWRQYQAGEFGTPQRVLPQEPRP